MTTSMTSEVVCLSNTELEIRVRLYFIQGEAILENIFRQSRKTFYLIGTTWNISTEKKVKRTFFCFLSVFFDVSAQEGQVTLITLQWHGVGKST